MELTSSHIFFNVDTDFFALNCLTLGVLIFVLLLLFPLAICLAVKSNRQDIVTASTVSFERVLLILNSLHHYLTTTADRIRLSFDDVNLRRLHCFWLSLLILIQLLKS
jgi:hypothetical protein